MASLVVTDKLTVPGPHIVAPVGVGAGGIIVGVKFTVTDAVALRYCISSGASNFCRWVLYSRTA